MASSILKALNNALYRVSTTSAIVRADDPAQYILPRVYSIGSVSETNNPMTIADAMLTSGTDWEFALVKVGTPSTQYAPFGYTIYIIMKNADTATILGVDYGINRRICTQGRSRNGTWASNWSIYMPATT